MACSEKVLKELGELLLDISHGPDREVFLSMVQKIRPGFKAPELEIKALKKEIEDKNKIIHSMENLKEAC